MHDSIENGKGVIGAVGELVKAAADSPKGKEAASNLGDTAVTVTRTLNNLLLPLAAVNAAFDAARNYFSGGFQAQLIERTKDIPLGDLVDPKVRVAGPALQAITFSCDEPVLRDMFVELIATSMNRKTAGLAHPSFVEIIRQLEPSEARILEKLLVIPASPVVQLHEYVRNGLGYRIIRNHLLSGADEGKQPIETHGEAAMIDNFIRLGLVHVDYTAHVPGEESYAWVTKRPEYLRAKKNVDANDLRLDIKKGVLQPTEFGKQFAAAVKLL